MKDLLEEQIRCNLPLLEVRQRIHEIDWKKRCKSFNHYIHAIEAVSERRQLLSRGTNAFFGLGQPLVIVH